MRSRYSYYHLVGKAFGKSFAVKSFAVKSFAQESFAVKPRRAPAALPFHQNIF